MTRLASVASAAYHKSVGSKLLPAEQDVDGVFANGGILSRLLRPAFTLIGRSWHVYPLGLLFGLEAVASAGCLPLGKDRELP